MTIPCYLPDEVVNLAIAPKNEAFYPGEFINCTAEGNPSPDIIWSPIKSSTPHQSKERLEIVEGMGADVSTRLDDVGPTLDDVQLFARLTALQPPVFKINGQLYRGVGSYFEVGGHGKSLTFSPSTFYLKA